MLEFCGYQHLQGGLKTGLFSKKLVAPVFDDTERWSTYQHVQYFVWIKIRVLSFITELLQRIFNCDEPQNTSLIPQKGLHIATQEARQNTKDKHQTNNINS